MCRRRHNVGMSIKKMCLVTILAVLGVQAVPVSAAPVTQAPVSATPFSWSDVKPIVGQSMKVSQLVTANAKGKLKYRVSGVCKLRNGTVSFTKIGKCRVSVRLSKKSGKEVARSSRFYSTSQAPAPVSVTLLATPLEPGRPAPGEGSCVFAPQNVFGFSPAIPNPEGVILATNSAGWRAIGYKPGEVFRYWTEIWICDQKDLTISAFDPMRDWYKAQGWQDYYSRVYKEDQVLNVHCVRLPILGRDGYCMVTFEPFKRK